MTIEQYNKEARSDLLYKLGIPPEERIYIPERDKSKFENEGFKIYYESTGYSSNDGRYYYEISENISEDDFQMLMQLYKAKTLGTIKNCVVFFTALAVVGLIGYFILAISTVTKIASYY